MDRISGLPDELLVKIISFVPTNVAVSTSILSKRWQSLWKWVPKLECDCSEPALWDFVRKNLPLRARIIEILYLKFRYESFQPDDFIFWVEFAVSHCLRELCIDYYDYYAQTDLLFSRNLYTCKSLVTLKLEGLGILVDVPRDVCLPSLKTLQLRVAYSKEDSLRLLLSYCPVLEDLVIELNDENNNVKALVVIVPTLQRLSLKIASSCSDERYLIVTPSLKYFKVEDDRDIFNALIENMPELEEADIYVTQHIETLLESVTSVKRLTLRQLYNTIDESKYRAGIVFNQLEQVKLSICNDYWSKLVIWLLKNSPKLRVLNLYVDSDDERYEEYEPDYWKNIRRSVPKSLKSSLVTLEFAGYKARPEERDFLSFIFKNARRLKTSSISH
ncbi:F-box domain [Arabidopsis suecica]|uniref:F-box domain n=1 Tax=Arabidopsis suecica TaxID=45249 RepID=A0A8T1Y0P3_ARASU|nr:F-box domain [Arabidopsis suecica]